VTNKNTLAQLADRDTLTRELRGLILESLVPLDDDELGNDSPLVDEILDSLGIAEMAVFIEDRIGRPLRPEEEVRATFASVNAVVDFILINA
jgi:acyl carrier protein